jgi:AmmeMemoRadiSam system protein A
VVGESSTRLLTLARQALQLYLESGTLLDTADDGRTAGGLFVTLRRRDGALRGCIGLLSPDQGLEPTVVRCSIAAATEDPRFPAVEATELADLRIEISLLSAMIPVSDPEEVEVGRDGLQIEKDGRRGLLLPQVAVQYGWDREEFLEEVCVKAGLGRSAWSGGALLHRFTAEILEEA